MARPLAIAASQLKSAALDAVIEQSVIPPAADETTTLPPAVFVPVRRTTLVGENVGALKLKAVVRPIGLIGVGVGVGIGVNVGAVRAIESAAPLILALALVCAGHAEPRESPGSAAAPTSATV